MLPTSRASHIVIHNETIYLAGQVASELKPDIGHQTRQVLAEIDKLLERAGSDKSRALAATCYLADMKDFDGFNAVWEAWIDRDNHPARTTVKAAMVSPDYLVEITVIAAR